jgi:LacI family transcriptional regulator
LTFGRDTHLAERERRRRACGRIDATVDRVLHRRAGVRQTTIQRVLEAAAKLEYLPQADRLDNLRPVAPPAT